MASRCFCPPERPPTRDLRFDRLLDRYAAVEKAAEEPDGLFHGRFFGELRLLQLQADTLAQFCGIRFPVQAEKFDDSGIGIGQPFADFNGGGLSGAVRSEQAEALAFCHFQIDAVNGDDVSVSLAQVAQEQRRALAGIQSYLLASFQSLLRHGLRLCGIRQKHQQRMRRRPKFLRNIDWDPSKPGSGKGIFLRRSAWVR